MFLLFCKIIELAVFGIFFPKKIEYGCNVKEQYRKKAIPVILKKLYGPILIKWHDFLTCSDDIFLLFCKIIELAVCGIFFRKKSNMAAM